MAERAQKQPSAKSLRWRFKQGEQIVRCAAVEDAPEAVVLHDSLRPIAEMAQIGEAHPVDAGRQATFPATPDQPRHVEQEGSVVGQAEKMGSGKAFVGWMPISRSASVVNAARTGAARRMPAFSLVQPCGGAALAG